MKKSGLFLLLGAFILCALLAPAGPSAFAQDAERLDEPAESAGDENAAPKSDGVEKATVEEEEGVNEIFLFLGRFHPVALHSPVGILSALLAFELLVLLFLRGQFHERSAARWVLLTLGSFTAAIAATFGMFLSWSPGYNENLIFWHKWTGSAVAVAAAIAWGLRVLYERSKDPSYNWGYLVSLIIAVLVLMPAGHFGAGLTHGTDYLTKYLPEQLAFLAPMLGETKVVGASATDDSVFGNQILPVLEAKCFECHSAEKQGGDLRLDSIEACLAGGESGLPSIVQGDAMASHMVKLMLLPGENEDVMPPRGKPKLTPEETLTLIDWVNRGAPWGDYETPEPIVAAASLDPSEVNPADMEPKPLVEMADTMKLFFERPFSDLRASLAEEPSGRAGISAVYNATYSLAEAHNLLFGLTEEDFMETDEWAAYAVQGRQLSAAIGDALKALDYPLMRQHFVSLVESCNGCHQEFSPDVDTVLLVAPAKEETVVEAEPAEEEGEDRSRRGRRGRGSRN